MNPLTLALTGFRWPLVPSAFTLSHSPLANSTTLCFHEVEFQLCSSLSPLLQIARFLLSQESFQVKVSPYIILSWIFLHRKGFFKYALHSTTSPIHSLIF